ncbi:MAG: hypothetical protein QME58_06055 [Bacteroidota bacterium]|nr:hypothetical protein [Bacteroidota bacterium]
MSNSISKISGVSLIVIAVIGFITVADEFRHTGEFIGVSSILFAGIILLIDGYNFSVSKRLSIHWVAIGVLSGIPLGGLLLDNMPLGVGSGMVIGIFVAFVLGKKNTKINRST